MLWEIQHSRADPSTMGLGFHSPVCLYTVSVPWKYGHMINHNDSDLPRRKWMKQLTVESEGERTAEQQKPCGRASPEITRQSLPVGYASRLTLAGDVYTYHQQYRQPLLHQDSHQWDWRLAYFRSVVRPREEWSCFITPVYRVTMEIAGPEGIVVDRPVQMKPVVTSACACCGQRCQYRWWRLIGINQSMSTRQYFSHSNLWLKLPVS